MALDFEAQQTLGVMAGTLAAWLKDNPDAREVEEGVGDADEFGMYAMSTGFLRMYRELLILKVIIPPTHNNPPIKQ